MANEFTGINLEVFKSHILYWITSVTGLEGFYISQKIPALENYFTIQFINIENKGTPWKTNNTGATLTTIKAHKLLTVRTTFYGANGYNHAIKTTNSLHGNTWNQYLRDNAFLGYGKTSLIRINEDFNYTDFLQQAQLNFSFNILVSTTEDIYPIESVEANIDIDTDNNLDNNELTLNIYIDYDNL